MRAIVLMDREQHYSVAYSMHNFSTCYLRKKGFSVGGRSSLRNKIMFANLGSLLMLSQNNKVLIDTFPLILNSRIEQRSSVTKGEGDGEIT